MKLNTFTKIRISTEMKKQIKEYADELGFRETDFCRFLLNRSLTELKSDIMQANGDITKLRFTLRK